MYLDGKIWPNEPSCVYQRRLFGNEYSVDAYFNRLGELVGASPRTRIRVAGGEVIESMTVNRPDLVVATRRVGEALGLTGPACIQFIEDKDDSNKPYVMEVNGRFGGGAPLSIIAGLRIPELVIDEYVNNVIPKPDSCGAHPNIYMTRSYEGHYFQI
jgi:biotin carboxylase